MGRKEDNIKRAQELMDKREFIRNIGMAAHIDHGKTTLSDNLIAGAGMMSEDLAGKQLMLDYDEQEQDRGITINAANASMVHEYKGKEYLINLIDTPGHVDFGGDVTRAMRALDGCIILICAVEGVMPQSETVIRQALKEKVKPLLFINKVDRLINELKVTPEEMQNRFKKYILKFNKLVKQFAPKELREEWQVKVEDGTVSFGSAYHNWAINVPFMKKSGITFPDIYEHLEKDDQKGLAKKAPVHEVLLDMNIEHVPGPLVTQKYRVPHIWHGDPDSKIGKSMVECDSKGPIAMMVTKIVMDPHEGEVAVGRLFSGTIEKGQELTIVGMPNPNRVQRVSLSVGADRIPVDAIKAGNIVAVSGLKDAIAGSTVSGQEDMVAFEQMKHYSEPVVTVAIEAKHTKDLPKLVEVLRSVSKADPSIFVDINQETGEHLMSGMGELHLEITVYRIINEYGVNVITSEPIVVYRESIQKAAGPFEGKSPNKHNKFYITVEPLEEEIQKAIHEGDIPSGDKKVKDKKAVGKQLQELGFTKEEAKGIEVIEGQNVFLDMTKGIQYLHETIELCRMAFKEVADRCPLAEEKMMGLKVKLEDAKLHEDSIHRGPAQVIPAVRHAINGSFLLADPVLLEPVQKVFIQVPADVMGSAMREIQSRRGVVGDIEQEGDMATIHAMAPVAEMFGFASEIRSATGGKALWNTENAGFERLPKELQKEIIGQIRRRKGLKPEPPTPSYYASQ